MWNGIRDWLRDVPIDDPVDRRNAPIMQLLFLAIGLTIPAAWLYFYATGGTPTGGLATMAIALVMATLAFGCLTMIRKGHFRPAVILFLIVLWTTGLANHLMLGFKAVSGNQVDQLLMLIICGLVLGRRALWIGLVAVLLLAAVGLLVDARRLMAEGQPVASAFSPLSSVLFVYGTFALILDHTIAALRESLAESNRRGQELQREMAERERTQLHLLRAQKMEATGRLATGVAHDFNNTLGIILGLVSQGHRADAPPEQRVPALERIMEEVRFAARRGETFSRKLLRFGRHDLGREEVFDVGHAMQDLKPLLRQMFDADIRLECRLDKSPLPIRLNRSRFDLMVLNIADNAHDAMLDGGCFTVATRRLATEEGASLELELSDDGQGMAEDVLAQAFEPFFSTKLADSHIGLGLSVVRDLVDKAGGGIHVKSAPGQGTTFRIRIPLANDPALQGLADPA